MSWPEWPKGSEPSNCPVYVHNEIVIPASPEATWKWLCRADLWPTWFKGCADVRFESGGPSLALGSIVVWRMLGATIRVTVRKSASPRALDWEGGARGVHAYHAWLLEPADGKTRLVTDETERGPLPWVLRWYLRGALHRAHQEWIESLARVAPTGDPAAAKP
jgi:hypothetical protein